MFLGRCCTEPDNIIQYRNLLHASKQEVRHCPAHELQGPLVCRGGALTAASRIMLQQAARNCPLQYPKPPTMKAGGGFGLTVGY